MDPVAPRQGCKLRDGVVYFGADAVRPGDFSEHPCDLGAQCRRAPVNECAYEAHCRLLAPRWNPRKPQSLVVLQAVQGGV